MVFNRRQGFPKEMDPESLANAVNRLIEQSAGAIKGTAVSVVSASCAQDRYGCSLDIKIASELTDRRAYSIHIWHEGDERNDRFNSRMRIEVTTLRGAAMIFYLFQDMTPSIRDVQLGALTYESKHTDAEGKEVIAYANDAHKAIVKDLDFKAPGLYVLASDTHLLPRSQNLGNLL